MNATGSGLPEVVVLERLTTAKTWRVAVTFAVRVKGRVFTIPVGFISDLDSVPRLPLIWLFFKGHAVAAAVVHDWLYRGEGESRAEADSLFHELLRLEGAGRTTAYFMWLGVRVGGWLPWGRHRRPPPSGKTAG